MHGKTRNHILSFIFLAVIFCSSTSSALAAGLEAPHDGAKGIGCLSCHQMTSTYPKLLPPLNHTPLPGDIDDTTSNGLCWSCHNDPTQSSECGGCHPNPTHPSAPYVLTHSSMTTDNGYGYWTVECWVCHNPHKQEQNLYNGSSYGMYIRRSINLANIKFYDDKNNPLPLPGDKSGIRSVIFKGQTGTNSFADGEGQREGICEVCHTQTKYFQNDGSSYDQNHGGRNKTNCTEKCHTHVNGFIHGGGSSSCIECHGHDPGYPYDGVSLSKGNGSFQSHSTHTETNTAQDNDVIGPPALPCAHCHDTTKFPAFIYKAELDTDGNGSIDLTETDVCNFCHSEDGPYDGLNDDNVGAKKNWRTGIYTADGTALNAGKERWCVTCHDSGTSMISGRQAPDVAGDDSKYGFYASGHGMVMQECAACHNVSTKHIDGIKSYKAQTPPVPYIYRAGYRLILVNNRRPFYITYVPDDECRYNQDPTDFELCYKCHSEQKLLSDTRAVGYYGCTTNPYNNLSSITTSFKEVGTVMNLHADHLIDVSGWKFAPIYPPGPKWDSDGDGTTDNAISCSTCHNPHGSRRTNLNANNEVEPTKMMTVTDLDIEWMHDATGDFGQVGTAGKLSRVCFNCHSEYGGKYYRTHPSSQLAEITIKDTDVPATADDAYTNDATVTVTIQPGSMTAPTQMRIAEDLALTVNTTGWIPYSQTYTYTLTAGEGTKTVYAQIQDGTGTLSNIKGYRIILDTTNPTVSAATLTAPNGGETWVQETVQDITWRWVVDSNLKPLTLKYSVDGGGIFTTIAPAEDNDGTYAWTVPVVESSQVKVRLIATDKAGNQVSDDSDNNFIIQPAGPVVLNSITAADNDSTDDAAAEEGYTNKPEVTVSFSVSNNPTHMICAPNADFSANLQPADYILIDGEPWAPYASPFTYTLSGVDGSQTIYCKVRNGLGKSGVQNSTIILDRSVPGLPVLTSPAEGNDEWLRNTDQTITWDTGSITDQAPGSLKALPVTLAYSQDDGMTYPNIIAAGIANSGSNPWRTPASASHSTKVRLTVTDRAGNQSSVANTVFIMPQDIYIVTNTNDSGAGSLRQAITNRITNGAGGFIWFDIENTGLPGNTLSNGVAVISLDSALPVLSQAGIIIDGTSQNDLQGDTNPYGPEIRITNPSEFPSLTGIDITAADVQVRDVQLTNWSTAFTSNAARSALLDSQVGFSSDSEGYALTDMRNGANVVLNASATAATIGNNFISCAGGNGISDSGGGTTISGNKIGLLPDGANLPDGINCPNGGVNQAGVYLNNADNDLILGNVICGSEKGIYLTGTATGNAIRGNTFGVWYKEGAWLDCNDQPDAILIWSPTAENNTIGGPNRATGNDNLNDSNVIDPGNYGIRDGNKASGYDYIYGNYIGTDTQPNSSESFQGAYGIAVGSVSNIIIGGGGTGQSGNVIANMDTYGVYLNDTNGRYITISQNAFSNNGNHTTDDIFLVADANEAISPPKIASATTSQVVVTDVATGDTVELYVYDYDGGTNGDGKKILLSQAVTSGTSVTFDVGDKGLTPGQWVTATHTKSSGSTSAFSVTMQVE